MKFNTVNKCFFSYKNTTDQFITHHIIKNFKIFNEYTIIFNGNKHESLSFINIKLYDNDDNKKEEIVLSLNDSYKFKNNNISKIEMEINLSEKILFSIDILERPIVFNENTYDNSPMLKEFINKVDSYIDNKHKVPTFNIKIACILDEFSYDCFSYDCILLQLKSMTWKKQLEEFEPNLLFVESAWYGVCKTWVGKVASDNKIDPTIFDIVNYCKIHNIPTVFYNKEGLINFPYFEKSSSFFDYVFVSDENIIPHQIKACKHDNIYPLSFAAQPKIHNSVNKNKYKLGEIVFAGGWYSDKHKERIIDFEYILKPLLKYDVHIYDRNFHQREMLEFIDAYWPKDYLNNIVGKLDYRYMVEAYKNYTVFLNVNSIQNSTYMVSRRVYEILACKTLLLSSYSKCINDSFSDYVLISKNKEDTIKYIDEIFKNSILYKKKAKESQRYILENHTYKDRLIEIFDTIKIHYTKPKSLSLGLICILENDLHIENLLESILNQSININNIYLIINKKVNIKKCHDLLSLKNIDYFFYDSNNSQNIINYISSLNHFISHYALFYSKNYYCQNYLRDYINIILYSNADIIGKSQVYELINNELKINICDNKDSYVTKIFNDTLFFRSNIITSINININIYESSINYFHDEILKLYSDDEYNFLRNSTNYVPDLNYYKSFISI